MKKLIISDVLVDMDGTISKIESTDFILDTLQEILIEKDKISSVKANKIITETIKKKKHLADYWKKFALAEELGVPEQELWERVVLWLKGNSCCYPDAIDMVKNLYKKKLNLHLATNARDPWLRARLIFCGLGNEKGPHYFKNLFNRDSGFTEKNNPGYYRKVLQKLEVNPEYVLMVGDSIEQDLYHAHSGGIKNVVIIHRAQKEKIIVSDAIYVNDLRVVLELIKVV